MDALSPAGAAGCLWEGTASKKEPRGCVAEGMACMTSEETMVGVERERLGREKGYIFLCQRKLQPPGRCTLRHIDLPFREQINPKAVRRSNSHATTVNMSSRYG